MVRVTWYRAFNFIAKTVPGFFRGDACVRPIEARLAASRIPIACEIGFDVIEFMSRVFLVRRDAVFLSRAIVVKACTVCVRTGDERFFPICVFDRRVDGFRNTLAGQSADDGTDRRADYRTDRPDHGAGGGTDDCAGRDACGSTA